MIMYISSLKEEMISIHCIYVYTTSVAFDEKAVFILSLHFAPVCSLQSAFSTDRCLHVIQDQSAKYPIDEKNSQNRYLIYGQNG